MSLVSEMVQVLLPRGSTGGSLVMLTAYFDDSGTHDDSTVLVMGGLVGSERHWEPFERQWKAKLAAPLPDRPPLARFHMHDCVAARGEFETYSIAERDALIHDFRQIIINSGVLGYAIAVSRADWDRIVAPTPMVYWFGDAEGYCFRDCVSRLIVLVRDTPITGRNRTLDRNLTFVFDNRPHRTKLNKFIFDQYQMLPLVQSKTAQWQLPPMKLHGLSFLDSETFVPLQGADMWAWENHYHAREALKIGQPVPIRPHAKQFFECGRFQSTLIGEAAAQKIVELLGVTQA